MQQIAGACASVESVAADRNARVMSVGLARDETSCDDSHVRRKDTALVTDFRYVIADFICTVQLDADRDAVRICCFEEVNAQISGML